MSSISLLHQNATNSFVIIAALPLQIKDKKTWELYAGDENIAAEWARELRGLRNGILRSSPLYAEFLRRLEEEERATMGDDMRCVCAYVWMLVCRCV